MTIRVCSLPLTCLAFLAAINAHPILTTAAELKGSGITIPSENLDQQFVFALLSPMSQLVQSPYGNPSAIENPLGTRPKSLATNVVVQSVINKPVATLPTRQNIEALKVESAEHSPKIDVRPHKPTDSLLPTVGATPSSLMPLNNDSSFAMMGR